LFESKETRLFVAASTFEQKVLDVSLPNLFPSVDCPIGSGA
jgi:hypothetical protein